MPYLHDEAELGVLRASEKAKLCAVPSTVEIMDGDARSLTSFPPLEQKRDEEGITCVENAVDGMATATAEPMGADVMEGVEFTSRPPSPPSGAMTPTLRLEQCPSRLWPQLPPPNYGAVKSGLVYRSAYPQDRNVEFIEGLRVRTVLCLVDTDPSEEYCDWVQRAAMNRVRVDVAPNKEGKVKTTWDSICEALLIVMDCANYPLYVHCNQGRHRTGCVIACLRKVQRWPIDAVLAEYRAYAHPKARDGDVELIKQFDPEAVYDYAKSKGYLDKQPFMKRMDSAIANVDALAEALSSKEGEELEHISGLSSNASVFSDDALEMRGPPIDPRLQNGRHYPRQPDLSPPPSASAHSVVEELAIRPASAQSTTSTSIEIPNNLNSTVVPDTTATVTELADDAMTPPAVPVSDPFARGF